MGLVACRWNYRYTYRVYISREFIFQRGCAPFLFLPLFFVYKGIANLFSALNMVSTHRYWWLYLVNGLLLLILGLLFFASPFTAAFSIIFCVRLPLFIGVFLLFSSVIL